MSGEYVPTYSPTSGLKKLAFEHRERAGGGVSHYVQRFEQWRILNGFNIAKGYSDGDLSLYFETCSGVGGVENKGFLTQRFEDRGGIENQRFGCAGQHSGPEIGLHGDAANQAEFNMFVTSVDVAERPENVVRVRSAVRPQLLQELD